jgi:hypothetical protein
LTYQHANDWDQEDDLNQAVEYEEHAANHVGGVKRFGFRSLECATVSRCLVCPRYSNKMGLHELATKHRQLRLQCSMHDVEDAERYRRESKKRRKIDTNKRGN